MQRRRERVEKWRREQAEKRGEVYVPPEQPDKTTSKVKSDDNDQETDNGRVPENDDGEKKWRLEDEIDEEGDDEEQDMEIDDEEVAGHDLKLPTKKKTEDEEDEDDKLLTNVDNIPLPEEPSEKKPSSLQPLVFKKQPIMKRRVFETKAKIKPEKVEVEDDDPDVDPLDAFMVGIEEEVKKFRGKTVKESVVGQKGKLIVGVAKKKEEEKSKGELLEQNQDALEYSSEEEGTTEQDLADMNVNLTQSKQKKVQTVTLEDITYKPFRKNFYIEVPELTKMTNEEVEEYRSSLEGIKVKGKNCPKPIKSWAHAGVTRKELELLKKQNYQLPTPIQAQAIPVIMSGRDMIGIAKTGSGKTLAFLLPMFRHILDQEELEPGEGPIGIIMTPTRELATQIWAECKKFTKSLGLRAVAVYGGTSISEQIGELKPGAEIVVCTPGRMIDMLAANNGRVTNLRRTTYLVLDEADRMFDMGFEPQVMKIIDGLRPDRQTVMFSATFPRIMEALARRILDKPIEVIVGGRSVVAKEIEQNVCILDDDDKFLKLLQVLGLHLNEERTAIVFVDKQEAADSLLKELMLARYSCLALHGGIDQVDRDSIIQDYKHKRINVLVATSVAARGLDVRHCYLVVNYDAPNHYEDYVHRVGRTGRANTEGIAWTFLTWDQGRYAGDIIKAFELSGRTAPDDVKELYNSYKLNQEAQGKKVKSGGGFSGKGFKFDEAEAQLMNDKKKQQKVALGLNDSDDEEDGEKDIDAEIENMLAPKKSVKQVSANPAASTTVIDPTMTAVVVDKLDAARRLQAKLSGLAPAAPVSAKATTEAFLKGEGLGSTVSALHAKALAEQRAERLQQKLKYTPKEVEYDDDGQVVRNPDAPLVPSIGLPLAGHGESFQRFEEELEINDFPQQARWRVTSREALAQISEYSEAGLTVRGTFYPPGAKVPEGERKLYLAIEGTNELCVSKARTEIIRLIKDELVKMQNSGHQGGSKGRYRVV